MHTSDDALHASKKSMHADHDSWSQAAFSPLLVTILFYDEKNMQRRADASF